MPIGTPVYAAAAGTVIRSVTGCANDGSLSNHCGGGFGNHVILLHGGGRATLYAHLSPDGTQVAGGAHVDCGQLIGHSGHSGHSTGPHLHFEVRSGVSDVTSYFASSAMVLDPYGGACSSQTKDLWVGGSPMKSCNDASMRDDAVVVGATHPSTVHGSAGSHVTQTWTIKNRGTTTWTPDTYDLEHQSGAFASANAIALPAGSSIAPGQQVRLTAMVTVPGAAGTHRGTWRMVHRGSGAFGGDATLAIDVAAAPRSCSSHTLGHSVNDGACVQVSYPGCGLQKCAWYRCADGAWVCSDESACSSDGMHANAACAPPPAPPTADGGTPSMGTDGGVPACMGAGRGAACSTSDDCCDGMACEADEAGDHACCHPQGNACGSSAECCGTMECAHGFCGCVPENQLCWNDADCCSGLGCIAGACRSTAGCGQEATSCSTEADCCNGLNCEQAAGGGNECCVGSGNRCGADSDCCGDMQCAEGHCQCRAQGESCSNLLDCCGALLCTNGVCSF